MLYQLSYASPHRIIPAHTAASPGERPFKRKISTAGIPPQCTHCGIVDTNREHSSLRFVSSRAGLRFTAAGGGRRPVGYFCKG
jgi:hypothetical protein